MSSPAAEITEPMKVTVDPQDPLPESNWIPRRWFVFVSLGIYAVLRLVGILKGEPSNWGLDTVALVNAVLYLVAPSAEQAAKMILATKAMMGGVTFKSHSTADAKAGTATSTTTAGQATPETDGSLD